MSIAKEMNEKLDKFAAENQKFMGQMLIDHGWQRKEGGVKELHKVYVHKNFPGEEMHVHPVHIEHHVPRNRGAMDVRTLQPMELKNYLRHF